MTFQSLTYNVLYALLVTRVKLACLRRRHHLLPTSQQQPVQGHSSAYSHSLCLALLQELCSEVLGGNSACLQVQSSHTLLPDLCANS